MEANVQGQITQKRDEGRADVSRETQEGFDKALYRGLWRSSRIGCGTVASPCGERVYSTPRWKSRRTSAGIAKW